LRFDAAVQGSDASSYGELGNPQPFLGRRPGRSHLAVCDRVGVEISDDALLRLAGLLLVFRSR
jgi:hypothetical protein